jgi:hypothetical protein
VRACRALSRWPQAGLAHDRRKTGSLSREPSSGQLQATHGGSTRAIRKSPALSKMSMKRNDMIGRPTIVHGDTTLRRRTTVRRDDMAGATTTTIRADERIPGKPAGMLRVTAPPPAGDFFLDSAVPRFLAQYPEISLDLSFHEALTDIVAEICRFVPRRKESPSRRPRVA